jgi:hypothetical protein
VGAQRERSRGWGARHGGRVAKEQPVALRLAKDWSAEAAVS